MYMGSKDCKWLYPLAGPLLVSLVVVPFLESSALAQLRKSSSVSPESCWPKSSEMVVADSKEQPGQDPVGTINGTILDETGALIEGAHVRLSLEGQSDQDDLSDSEGEFSFSNVLAGPFELKIMFGGFTTHICSGTLRPGENYAVPPITLVLASTSTNIEVALSQTEVAEAELKDQEKQRVFGALPNFYVTYDPAAPPLTVRQKFKLAWKATTDPVNFVVTAGTGGMGQAANSFAGYGQGAQGYAKRFAGAYADSVTGTFLGGAILPSIFRQDPRYFYKGAGTVHSRILYALTRAVVCKNDKGQWQANYSAIVGGFAAAGISNLYYPSARSRADSTIENTLVGIGSSAVTNVLQELIFRKLTPHAPNYAAAAP
jgi:hypothetical protein